MTTADRPTGTVTFLFTDIEGSTQLWENDRAAMQTALERHDVILRSAIEGHGGYVFSTAGDAFAAAFTRAGDAVDAAVDAQRLLAAEPWPVGAEIRVRMGLHTGEAQERGGDYFGSVLNRAARVMSAGHGGQIVVGASTASVVDGVDLVDLGEHRLKDLSGLERLFQVRAEGLESAFAPLRTVSQRPSNLPLAVDEFVGRAGDLVDVVAALSESRLVTLTGVGGTGKTRLAVEAAAELLPQFVDGVWLVELAPVSEAAAVPFVVGAAVGAVQQPGKSMLDSLLGSLATRDLLLIVDNCEHLLDQVAELVSAVESRCRGVKVLATSREGLGLRGERLLAVGSLPVSEAAELFAARAAAVGVEVAVSDETVARIVERLDGLPLAIELAAARTRGFTVAEIEERLTERFRLLRGSSRGRVERHQTLWNTVAWSHQLLEPVERLVFDRLSVFAGGFTLEAATNVCSTDGVDGLDVEDAVLGLVERSMVVADIGGDGTRYRLLETLRQFGESQLLEAGTIDEFRGRHARWYAEFARTVAEGAKGPDGVVWSRRLRAELDNYRAVIYSDDLVSARRILAALEGWPVLWEAFEYIDWALAVLDPPAPDDPDWIAISLSAAFLTLFVGRSEDRAWIAAHIDPDAIPSGMLSYHWLNHQVGDAIVAGDDTAPLLRPMLDIATALDNDFDRLFWTSRVAYLATTTGDFEFAAEVRDHLSEDDPRSTAPAVAPAFFGWRGICLAAIGDPDAYGCLETARRLSTEYGQPLFAQATSSYQIPLLIQRGDLTTAQHRITETIAQQVRSGNHLMFWLALQSLTRLLDEIGHRDEALELWAELRDRPSIEPAQRADLETRLGPAGQPRLDDDGLMMRTKEILGGLA